jgi:hypothetical protein
MSNDNTIIMLLLMIVWLIVALFGIMFVGLIIV